MIKELFSSDVQKVLDLQIQENFLDGWNESQFLSSFKTGNFLLFGIEDGGSLVAFLSASLAFDTCDIEDILVDAYALVREASKRVLGKEHYKCQVEAGIAILDNKIAEMATGEGKTLSAVMPAYIKSLEGKGVHIITSNDYLAERDYLEMGKLFDFLGVSTGLIQSDTPKDERRKAYAQDITYCSNTQVCFDYLRDNLVYDKKDKVLRGFGYALVDEADSILIDEAETPIIISRKQEKATKKYFDADVFVQNLK